MAPEPVSESSWSMFATAEELTALSGAGEHVYVLGHAGTLFHHDGSKWTASLPFHNRLYWSKLWCVSPQDVFAVGVSRVFANGRWNYGYHMFHYDGSVAVPMTMSTSSPILDFWGSSGSNVFAVGAGGMIQRYDGSSWQPLEIGISADILAIWGLPTGELFVALRNAVLYYDGAAWTQILTSSQFLTDIWPSSRDDVYVAQEGDAVLHFDGQTWAPTGGSGEKVWGSASDDIFAATGRRISHFDGQSWQTSTLSIYDFAIGDLGGSQSGTFLVGNGIEEYGGPNIFRFDGTTWSKEPSAMLLPFNLSLVAISGNEQELYVGGAYTSLLHHDGSSWSRRGWSAGAPVSDIGMGTGGSLVCIGDYGEIAGVFDGSAWTQYRPPGDTMYVWGSHLSDVFLVGWDGKILHFDGSAFRSMESGTTEHLYDVWGHSGTEVYAAGSNGTIIAYDGSSWQPMESTTTADLQALWGDAETVVAVGDQGTILHFSNGKWMPMNSPTAEPLTGVWGASATDIYAVGAHVVLHYDGSRWVVLSEALGGLRVWGRSSSEVYLIDGRRVLRYGARS